MSCESFPATTTSNLPMTVSKIAIAKRSETHALGTAVLRHGGSESEVQFVAKLSEVKQDGEEVTLDHNARYFSSPLVAQTNFIDVSEDQLKIAAFEGRDLSAMTDFLSKTTR